MKNPRFGFLLLVIFLIADLIAYGQSGLQKTSLKSGSLLPEFNENAVVKIFTYNGLYSPYDFYYNFGSGNSTMEPNISHGSGVMIEQNGLILTARHVVDSARLVVVKIPGNSLAFLAEIVPTPNEADYAFIQIKGKFDNFVRLSPNIPKLLRGETIWTYGYPILPGEPEPNITRGMITRFSKHFNNWQIDAVVHPGSSGGPMVNDKGEICGIIVAQLTDRAGLNFALPMDTIIRAYKSLNQAGAFQNTSRRFDMLQPDEVDARMNLAIYMTEAGSLVEKPSARPGLVDDLKNNMLRIRDTSKINAEWTIFKEILASYYYNQAITILDKNNAAVTYPSSLESFELEEYRLLLEKSKNEALIAQSLDPRSKTSLGEFLTSIDMALGYTVSEVSFGNDYSEETNSDYWTQDDINKLVEYFDKSTKDFTDYWGFVETTDDLYNPGRKSLVYTNLVVRLNNDKVTELVIYYSELQNVTYNQKTFGANDTKEQVLSALGNEYEKLASNYFDEMNLTESLRWKSDKFDLTIAFGTISNRVEYIILSKK